MKKISNYISKRFSSNDQSGDEAESISRSYNSRLRKSSSRRSRNDNESSHNNGRFNDSDNDSTDR